MRQAIFLGLGTVCPLALVLGWWHSAWWELAMLPPLSMAAWATLVPSCQWWGPVLCVFPTRRREALLTFDHGPDPVETPLVLELLDQHRAKALFFVSGSKALRCPELVQQITARGHGLGLHGMTDGTDLFLGRSAACWRRDIRDSLAVVGAILPGYRIQWFRTATGCRGPGLQPALQSHQLQLMAWSASDGMNRTGDFESLVIRLRRDVDQGAIIRLRHGLCDQEGVTLLPDLLQEMLLWLRGQSYHLGEDT